MSLYDVTASFQDYFLLSVYQSKILSELLIYFYPHKYHTTVLSAIFVHLSFLRQNYNGWIRQVSGLYKKYNFITQHRISIE